MLRKFGLAGGLILGSLFAHADGPLGPPAGQPIVNSPNPQAGTFFVSSATVQNVNVTTVTFSNGTIMTTAASGSGASALSVKRSGVQISSPTSSIDFSGSYWGVSLNGTSTATITLNGGNTNYVQIGTSLIAGTTFFVSSATINNLNIGSLSGVLKATSGAVSGSATTSDLPEGSNPYFTIARTTSAFSAVSPLSNINGVLSIGSVLPAGATNYVQNGSLLQGATFYVSSGTVAGQFTSGTHIVTGVLITGSGANQITNAAGLIDATKLTNLVPNALIDGSSVTKQGNVFNGAGQLLQLNGIALVPNANVDIASITKQGNVFNGNNQLVQLDGSSKLPAVNGAALTSLNGVNITGIIPAVTLSTAILNQNSLQSGATFYVSSGTVAGQFSAMQTSSITAALFISSSPSNTDVPPAVVRNNSRAGISNMVGFGFDMPDNTSSKTRWGEIRTDIQSNIAGAETGYFRLFGMHNGVLTEFMTFTGGNAFNGAPQITFPSTSTALAFVNNGGTDYIYTNSAAELRLAPSAGTRQIIRLDDWNNTATSMNLDFEVNGSTGEFSWNGSNFSSGNLFTFSSTTAHTGPIQISSTTTLTKLSPGVLHIVAASSVTTTTPVSLSTEVTGNLPVTNLNNGSSAGGTTFWRGDGTWSVPPGSGGASALAVSTNSVIVSSPTSKIDFLPPFKGSLIGSSTAQISLDVSSVTLQGNIFNGTNQLVKTDGSGLIPNSVYNASSVTLQGNVFNGANKLIQFNGSSVYPAGNGNQITALTASNLIGAIPASNLGNAVLNQNSLQLGTTAYPQFLYVGSSATVTSTMTASYFIGNGGGLTNVQFPSSFSVSSGTITNRLEVDAANIFDLPGNEWLFHDLTNKGVYFGINHGHFAGPNNICIGDNSCFNIDGTSGSSNTYVGASAGPVLGGQTTRGSLAIGYNAEVTCDNCGVIGDPTNANFNLGIGTDTPASKLDVYVNGSIPGVNISGSYGTGTTDILKLSNTSSWNFANNIRQGYWLKDNAGNLQEAVDVKVVSNDGSASSRYIINGKYTTGSYFDVFGIAFDQPGFPVYFPQSYLSFGAIGNASSNPSILFSGNVLSIKIGTGASDILDISGVGGYKNSLKMGGSNKGILSFDSNDNYFKMDKILSLATLSPGVMHIVAISSTISTGLVSLSTEVTSTLPSSLISGTTTNDDAPAGSPGEYISSTVVTATAYTGTTGQYANLCSIVLSSGDWNITGVDDNTLNGATVTQTTLAISTNTGNTTTDHQLGDNQLDVPLPIAAMGGAQAIPEWRKKLTTQTTIYLKLLVAYVSGNIKYQCRLSARRAR